MLSLRQSAQLEWRNPWYCTHKSLVLYKREQALVLLGSCDQQILAHHETVVFKTGRSLAVFTQDKKLCEIQVEVLKLERLTAEEVWFTVNNETQMWCFNLETKQFSKKEQDKKKKKNQVYWPMEKTLVYLNKAKKIRLIHEEKKYRDLSFVPNHVSEDKTRLQRWENGKLVQEYVLPLITTRKSRGTAASVSTGATRNVAEKRDTVVVPEDLGSLLDGSVVV